MPFPTKVHDPQALLDYPLNIKEKGWLEPGDALASATVAVPADLVLDHIEVDTANGVIIPWIKVADPTVKKKFTFTYHWITTQGREDERSRTLDVKER